MRRRIWLIWLSIIVGAVSAHWGCNWERHPRSPIPKSDPSATELPASGGSLGIAEKGREMAGAFAIAATAAGDDLAPPATGAMASVTPPPLEELRLLPGKRSSRAGRAMVVSVNRDATQIGVDILRSGGNAVDASVAVALALAVTHPSAGNLGGGGFALVRLTDETIHALDFRESSPAHLSRERFKGMVRSGGEGADAVGIPGSVAGLFELSTRYGRLPFAQLVEPARQLAVKGHIVSQREATAIRVAWAKLKRVPLALKRYGNASGQPLPAGTKVPLPELASTLARLKVEGRDGFYTGPVAASVVAALGADPQIQDADLANYRAHWRIPLTVPYRGLKVTIMPPPSAGGIALAVSLKLLEAVDPTSLPRGTPQHAHLLLEIMRRAQADRLYEVVDPDIFSLPEQERLVSQLLTPERWVKRCPIDPNYATPNQRVVDPVAPSAESEHTTHLAVVDADGMAVSLTTTLSSGFGSKLVTDSGIVLNNALGSFSAQGRNQPLPNRRTTSSMAPTMLEDRSGLRLILGTPGGDTIPSTLLQLINSIVDYSVPVDAAVDAPRLHQSVARNADARFETRRPIPLGLQRGLRQLGHRFTNSTAVMGHANTIAIIDGAAFGYADPREGGLAMGLAAE